MKYILVGLIFLFSSVSFADSFKSKKETREFSNDFMDNMVAGKFQKGFDLAKPYWPISADEIDGIVNQINTNWPAINQRFGKSIDKEFIQDKRIGKSFVRYYYLHKFENHSIYWQIDFYKPKSEWKVNTITFLDNLEVLFE